MVFFLFFSCLEDSSLDGSLLFFRGQYGEAVVMLWLCCGTFFLLRFENFVIRDEAQSNRARRELLSSSSSSFFSSHFLHLLKKTTLKMVKIWLTILVNSFVYFF